MDVCMEVKDFCTTLETCVTAGLVQVVAAIRMAMYHIGQLKRTPDDHTSRVELYWLDAVGDVPALCETLVKYLPKLQASPSLLLQV
jgi:hypothetical protein